MLYELARRLKEEGRARDEIRAELERVGARKEEVDVLLGSLGLSSQPMTAAPDLLAKTARVTSSRWFLGLVLLGMLTAVGPLAWLAWLLIDGFRTGR